MKTKAQETALAHPCVEAEETAHRRYGTVEGRWSRRLTINAGFE